MKDIHALEFCMLGDSDPTHELFLLLRENNYTRAQLDRLITEGAELNSKGISGNTLLMEAAIQGNLVGVTTLLERGAEINAIDDSGMTALMYAAENGHFTVVTALLNNGASIGLCDSHSVSALRLAFWAYDKKPELDYRERCLDTIHALVNAGANTETTLYRPLMFLALSTGRLEFFKEIMKTGVREENNFQEIVLEVIASLRVSPEKFAAYKAAMDEVIGILALSRRGPALFARCVGDEGVPAASSLEKLTIEPIRPR